MIANGEDDLKLKLWEKVMIGIAGVILLCSDAIVEALCSLVGV